MSVPLQEETSYAARIEIAQPPRDLISIGLAWAGAWCAVVMIAKLIAMRAQMPWVRIAHTAGYVLGAAVGTLTSSVLSALLGGAILGVGVAFVSAEEEDRTARTKIAGIGAIAGVAASLVALVTRSNFPTISTRQVTVGFHGLVGAALALVVVGLFHKYRRRERDELVEEMQAFHRERMRQEAARILSQRENQPVGTADKA